MSSAEHNAASQQIRMQEAAAEAGPGAAQTDAPPVNATLDGETRTHDSAQGSDVSSDNAPEKEGHAHDPHDAPLEKAGTGKKAIIMFALGMAVFLAALDVTIITTALPTISEHFQSSAGYTWIGSAYTLANAAGTPTWGKISDIFGRKPVLMAANLVFLIGSLVAALSTSIGMLIAARAVQGLGGGGLVTLVNICIGDLFSLRSRGAYYGIIGGVWALASAVGPIFGGLFTEKVTWRWCFYINLPLDGAALAIIFFFLDLKTPKTPLIQGVKAIDWLGSFAVVGGTLMFLFGLEYGGVTYPWNSAIVVCLILFGVITFGLFFVIEWKVAKYPVVPLGIFSSRSNCATLGACAIHGCVFIASNYYLPLYFQAVRGATPLLSGVYILPSALSLSVASLATGIIIRKTGQFLPLIWFGFFAMTVGYGLFVDIAADSSWAKLILYQVVAGLGIGPLFQSPLIALQSHTKPRDIATATATFGFCRQLATSISIVIGNVVYQNQMTKKYDLLRTQLPASTADQLTGSGAGANVEVVNALPSSQRTLVRTAFADSLQSMWIMYVCFSAVGLLVSFLISNRKLSQEHEVTKTGLEVEKANRAEREQEKADKADKKAKRQSGHVDSPPSTDLEKAGTAGPLATSGATD